VKAAMKPRGPRGGEGELAENLILPKEELCYMELVISWCTESMVE